MEILVEVFWTEWSSEQEQIWDKRSKLQKPSPRFIIVVTFTFTARPENVLHCPPLSEGEGLACRGLQVTPFIIHVTMFYICVCIWFDYVRCVLYVFIFNFTFSNFAFIYTFMTLCIHVCIWKSCEYVGPQLTPAKFLAPVLLEVPHFSPVGEERWLASVPSPSSSSSPSSPPVTIITIIITNIPLPLSSLCHFNFSRKWFQGNCSDALRFREEMVLAS